MIRKAFDDHPFTALATIIGVLFLAVWLAIALLVSPAKAQAILEEQGYGNIVVTDKDIFGIQWVSCSKLDLARFTAIAETPEGNFTEVHVCVGPVNTDVIRSN